jgi:N-methylhydantoinase B/oxoprolinase/acetone carboxylase alpha subunit
MKNLFIHSGLLLIVIFLTTILNTNNLTAMDHYKKGSRFKYMDQLTEEQRETVKNTVRDLHDSGETPENIHEKVKEMLKESGVDVPDDAKLFPPMRGHRPGRFMERYLKDLDEDQRSALKEKVDQLHDQGASREEIHAEVQKMLESYGIEIPEKPGRHGEKWPCLTDEQRQAVRTKIREMRASDASREEIHEAAKKMTEEFRKSQEME